LIDATSFLVIVATAAAAGLVATAAEPRFAIPVVVIELLLGILIGPQVADLAHLDSSTMFFGNLGLGMLFFFAGYEIDLDRIRGVPLHRASIGWGLSLVLAYGLAGILVAANVIVSDLYTGSAMATTAIGTLIPILRDAGELRTRFGTYLLAAGAFGEFGPIMLVTLLLSTTHPLHEAVILVFFVFLAVVTGVVAVRSAFRGWPLLERTFETSSQLAVRLAVVLIFGLVALAQELGLDLLLGGFVAGMITRQALRGHELVIFDSKLNAVGYGFLIPFFFVTSGMAFNATLLFTDASAAAKLPLFTLLFLVIRGLPALLLYRGLLPGRDRIALGIFCATELPLVVAITTLALKVGDMRGSTATALVGAAIISTLVYPLIGLRLRRDRIEEVEESEEMAPESTPLPARR
jgi:Kef-type K+ transport system membrane component KefB